MVEPGHSPAQGRIAGGVGLLGRELGGGRGEGSVLSKWCFCLTPSEPPPETVSAQMEMTVTVTSMEYTEELEDRSSAQFQSFNKTFTDEVSLGTQGPVRRSALPREQSLEVKKAAEGCSPVRGLGVSQFTPCLRSCQRACGKTKQGSMKG